MTGIFTYRNFSLQDTPSLDGQVAVITVIVVARSEDKFTTAREEWRCRQGISLGEGDTRVDFVKCDLGDIKAVWAAAQQIKQKTEYIHILICNAGLGIPTTASQPHTIDPVFATNCISHQALTTLLLPHLKKAATTTPRGARVVVTSSSLHLLCRTLDPERLSSPPHKWPALHDGVWRYARSKLGNILFAKELSRRLLEDEDGNPANRVFVNSYFPGNIVTAQWEVWGMYLGPWIGGLVRWLARVFGQSVEEGAATAVYLATSGEVSEGGMRGRYFVPVAKDWIDAQVAETLGADWQSEK
ncbi:uncharacterized protein N7482_010254 [Penicillium canariense]|uniref:Uncharacterized protein n=1 Tax=Penicillium canariense TaxID=189055 RepID=A0A9W9HMM6_9EURO|nr:uncharacterized protein N7482_010254 [Penicillium canariense]KAJ5151002.1 hypothetical protein N7482_010254 [Penicillium canariense]